MDAVIYTRISKDRTGEHLGVERQEQDCRDLAASLGYTVTRLYSDNDISATSGKRRPDFERLLQDAPPVVIVWHQDRLLRVSKDLERVLETGATVHQVKAGTLDLSTPTGKAVARTITAWSTHETEHQRQRLLTAKAQAKAAGKWLGGRRPYGLEADGTTVRTSEAALVVQAATGLLEGRSLRALAGELGMVGTSGRPVDGMALRRILQNQATAKVLPADVHTRVVALLADPSRKTTTTPDRKWLLSGIARCSVCNQAVHSHSGSGRARSYTCQAKHVARDLVQTDQKVMDAFAKRLVALDLADLLPYSAPDSVSADTHELTKVRADLIELAQAHGNGLITLAQMVQSSQILSAREKALESRLAQVHQASPLGALAASYDPSAAFLASPLDVQRKVIDLLAVITIKPGRRGRPKGWVPGQPYADMESVVIEWRAAEGS